MAGLRKNITYVGHFGKSGCSMAIEIPVGLFVAVELVGVDEVVPDAVEAAYYGGDGGEEGVAYPDGEDCVFLTAGLAGGDFLSVEAPDLAPEPELEGAAYERYRHEP